MNHVNKQSFYKVSARRALVISYDACMIPVAWFGAYWLRFNLELIPFAHLEKSLEYLVPVFIIQLVSCWYFGLYRGIWRYASLFDLLRIVRSVIVSVLFSLAFLYVAFNLVLFPRSIFPLYSILLIIALGGGRIIFRLIKEMPLSFSTSKKNVF